MAESKTEKKGSKKDRKKGDDRNTTPKLNCPFVSNARWPVSTEGSGELATKHVEFIRDKKEWTASVREAYANGKTSAELPKFDESKFVDPNVGVQLRKDYEALVDEYHETGEGIFYPRYNPVLVDLVRDMNCRSCVRGAFKTYKSPPKDWDEEEYGNWWHEWEDEDGEMIKQSSGWHFLDKTPRSCHANRAENLIDDPKKNILTFGNYRYVVGEGSHDAAACFMIWQTKSGNYRAGDSARKRFSFAGNKEVTNCIFKIEDKPNNGGGFTVKGKWAEVREMVYGPGQVFTAGNLYDSSGKQLTAKEIRALPSDTKGIKFKALEAPIVGKATSWKGSKGLWQDILSVNESYEEKKSIRNILVHGKRVDPIEAVPYGLKGSQIHMVAYIIADGDGSLDDGCFSMGVVIGARANAEYNVGVVVAREGIALAAKPKPKAKSKSKPKVKVADKSTESDAAPPVEIDTSDEVVEVDAVVTAD